MAKREAPPNIRVERVGLPAGGVFDDLYHGLLVASWPRFFGIIALVYLAVNSAFGLAYWAVPGCLENARDGSFADAFFFSVQTVATIGYGKMTPAGTYANLLVTCESLLGMFAIALVTGLTFAKFSRPTARVLFSEVAVVCRRDGARSLMVRMANQRSSHIIDVNLFMVLSADDTTPEGERVRRFHTLELTRARAATFALSWTAIHPITPSSPLHGLDADALVARRADIILIITGIDETFAQTVHARANYPAARVRFDERFVDILREEPGGGRVIDYRRFHDTVPIPE